uniref:LEM domain containing 1 n=1 Tax=Nannospalax galili TaxID=1026970 RepID=A0A8C6W448_NANGA
MVGVQCLTDCELHNQLEKLGFSPGPILPSTRKMYEKKLVELLVSPPCKRPVTSRHRESDEAEDSDKSEGVLQDWVPGPNLGVSPKRRITVWGARALRAGSRGA